MASLLGHVDRADPFLLAGWALCPEDPGHKPEVAVVQSGEKIITLRPAFSAPQVRSALGLPPSKLPPLYAWRLWFPLSNGLKPEIPFSIVFAQDGRPLTLGADRRMDLVAHIDTEAADELRHETLFFPSVDVAGDRIKLWVKAAGPVSTNPPRRLALRLNQSRDVFLDLAKEAFLFEKPVYNGHFEYSLSQLLSEGTRRAQLGLRDDTDSTSLRGFHNSLRTLHVPDSLRNSTDRLLPIPDAANIHRVSGPSSNATQYLIGGFTTFVQLNAMTMKYFGRPLTEFPVVVDWGVGCARVMRHFYESTPSGALPMSVLGLDIDQKNVDWCRSNMKGLGTYDVLSFDGFKIEGESVDLLYGISVLTHLSEFHQHLWLSEIARILKPGGVAILTTHGEFVIYGEYSMSGSVGILNPFIDKFGFFDGTPDGALGEEMETYYRASYHSRRYIRSNWTRYLKIVDFIPAANAFRQDFVVLKK